jgi:hypothetical protein
MVMRRRIGIRLPFWRRGRHGLIVAPGSKRASQMFAIAPGQTAPMPKSGNCGDKLFVPSSKAAWKCAFPAAGETYETF